MPKISKTRCVLYPVAYCLLASAARWPNARSKVRSDSKLQGKVRQHVNAIGTAMQLAYNSEARKATRYGNPYVIESTRISGVKICTKREKSVQNMYNFVNFCRLRKMACFARTFAELSGNCRGLECAKCV